MTYSVRGALLSCAALFLFAFPALSQAQSSTAPQDFRLGRPHGAVGVRGSLMVASANSDIYDFVTDVLAVEKSDFNTGSFAVDLSLNLLPQLDIVGTWDMNAMNQPSDYRDWEDNRGMPIQQTTELDQMNFTASAKYSILPRGRNISRLAWIPRTFVPYVGAGGGYGKYTFRQNGDFVDFDNGNKVFTDTFRSEGWAPTFHVMGGLDIQAYKHLMLSFDTRYSWQKADLSNDFVGFEPIDLGGFRFGAGVHLTF